jgi:hypothetical protein
MARLFKRAGAALGGLVYLWVASVRNLPAVRHRKARRRARSAVGPPGNGAQERRRHRAER